MDAEEEAVSAFFLQDMLAMADTIKVSISFLVLITVFCRLDAERTGKPLLDLNYFRENIIGLLAD